MFYFTFLSLAVFILLRVNAFLKMVPVYDTQTDKGFLFPEEFIRMVLEKQRLLSGEVWKTEKLEHLDEEGITNSLQGNYLVLLGSLNNTVNKILK